MGEGTERAIGPKRRRWPIVVWSLVGAFVLACVGIVTWSFIDEPDEPVDQAAPREEPDTVAPDGGLGVVIGEGEVAVNQQRRLFTRTLEGDVEIRALVTDNLTAEQIADMEPTNRPLWCESFGWMEATIITPDIVSFNSMSRYAQTPPGGFYQVSSMPVGDDLLVSVAVSAPTTSRMVRVAVPGGGLDEMEPVEGLAVLTVLVPDGAAGIDGGIAPGGFGDGVGRSIAVPFPGNGVEVTVQIELADGSTVEVPQPGSPQRSWTFPEESRECNPNMNNGGGFPIEPPIPEVTLPDAGAEQPDDPQAARTEIEANHGLLYSLTPEEDLQRLALLDDPTGVLDALEQVRAPGSIIETVDGDITIAITDLVFTSATEAQFLYDLNAGTFAFPDNRGRAVLRDGVWKITRGTYCQDLARASAGCGP